MLIEQKTTGVRIIDVSESQNYAEIEEVETLIGDYELYIQEISNEEMYLEEYHSYNKRTFNIYIPTVIEINQSTIFKFDNSYGKLYSSNEYSESNKNKIHKIRDISDESDVYTFEPILVVTVTEV